MIQLGDLVLRTPRMSYLGQQYKVHDPIAKEKIGNRVVKFKNRYYAEVRRSLRSTRSSRLCRNEAIVHRWGKAKATVDKALEQPGGPVLETVNFEA